jgi:predicted nucleic acid-binding protein
VRAPSSALVVDSAILIAAARGKTSGAIAIAARRAALVTTDRVVQEARRRIELGLNRPDLLAVIDKLTAEMTIVPVTALASILSQSEIALREAVSSRNGSVKDAHVLALAWSIEADIWSTDRDFAGTGVATWSTPNLMNALVEAAGEESST